MSEMASQVVKDGTSEIRAINGRHENLPSQRPKERSGYDSKGKTLAGSYPKKHMGVANQVHWESIAQAGAGLTKDRFVQDHSDASELSSHEKLRSDRAVLYSTEKEEKTQESVRCQDPHPSEVYRSVNDGHATVQAGQTASKWAKNIEPPFFGEITSAKVAGTRLSSGSATSQNKRLSVDKHAPEVHFMKRPGAEFISKKETPTRMMGGTVPSNGHPSIFDEEMQANHGNPNTTANGILHSDSDFDSSLNEPFGNEVDHQALYAQALPLQENQPDMFRVPFGMAYAVSESSTSNSVHNQPVDASTTPAPQSSTFNSVHNQSVDISTAPVAIAVKDNFKEHLLHNRKTQFGLAVVFIMVVGLAVSVGVILGPEPPPQEVFFKQISTNIDGLHAEGEFGATVSTNREGTRVAIAAPGVTDDTESDQSVVHHGMVEVRELQGDKWILLGETIRPKAYYRLADQSINKILDQSINKISLALSRSGDVLAIGLPFHGTTTDTKVGQVEVYRFLNGSWKIAGHPIVGTDFEGGSGNYFGASVSISSDGGIVAVGAPGSNINGNLLNSGSVSIFQFERDEWDIYGSRRGGERINEALGGSVSLSGNGLVVAAGSKATEKIKVAAKVFQFIAGNWNARSVPIVSGAGMYDTEYDVALSEDATRVVISNHYVGNSGPTIQSGEKNKDLYAHAFDYNPNQNIWEPLGRNLHMDSPGVKSGYFITLSDDGEVIGMGDPGRKVRKGQISGHAHIYIYSKDNGEWQKAGPDIDGEAPGDMFGFDVSISGDAKHFIIGAPSSRGDGYGHGRVQVYKVPDHA